MLMITNSTRQEQGSVLVMTIMTITIMTMICATSLYITSQNTNSGMQTASWQHALSGAETGVDLAVRALNTGVWNTTGWKTINGTALPALEQDVPAGSTATALPDNTHYNYLPSTYLASTTPSIIDTVGEGSTQLKTWVTVDNVGGTLKNGSSQCYRVRSTGLSTVSGPIRASANRLDDELRNTIALNFSRKVSAVTQGAVPLGPSRTIEVIMQAPVAGGWPAGITLGNWISDSGSGSIDSFNSSGGVPWSLAGRLSNPGTLVDTMNTSGQSDLRNTYVYGGMNYSGPAIKNTTEVKGAITTPDSAVIYPTFDPVAGPGNSGYSWTYTDPAGAPHLYSWGPGAATVLSSGSVPTSITASGTSGTPGLYIINGDFTLSGSNVFTINPTSGGTPAVVDPTKSYVTIWVKGKFTTSGSAVIKQTPGTTVTWIVDNDITVSGSSYNNQTNVASATSFIAVSGALNSNGTYQQQHQITVSGSGTFTGTVDGPGLSATISGSGDYSGALIANNLTISGSASFHYDTALSSNATSGTTGTYAFANWFEDNSDWSHKDVNGNTILY